MISDGKARRIAADWQSARPGYLAAFASSGATRVRTDEATCGRCGCDLLSVCGTYVANEPGTTADGLVMCPPDPDREPEGDHVPVPADLLAEIRALFADGTGTVESRADLTELCHYVTEVGWRGPQSGWCSVWE